MREEEKIFAGILFSPGDPELVKMKLKAHNLSLDYNQTHEDEVAKRQKILGELIGSMGTGVFLQGPIQFHYGSHTTIGDNVFINFNFTVQDDTHVTIDERCNFGPNVTIVTPCHPMLADERREILNAQGEPMRYCYAKPVHIGHDCWIGANVTVCPGVTIGENCVIGAGSVVTRDIPANSFAAGVPCKVIREITEADSMRYMPEVLADNTIPERSESHDHSRPPFSGSHDSSAGKTRPGQGQRLPQRHPRR